MKTYDTHFIEPLMRWLDGRSSASVNEFLIDHPDISSSDETRRAIGREIRAAGFVKGYVRMSPELMERIRQAGIAGAIKD